MPAPGWKSVAVTDRTAELVSKIAETIDRSASYVVDRVLNTAAVEILEGETEGFDEDAACRFGLHGPVSRK